MHRCLLIGALLLTGCSTIGPFASRPPQRVDDPHLPIYEQEIRGRDQLALPMHDPEVAPRTYMEFPGVHGR